MEDEPQNFPLVERFHKAEYLSRELSEHLKQSLLPRLSELRHASKVQDFAQVSDQEMLDRITALLDSECFAVDLYQRLQKFLESIEKETRGILDL